jgi:glyoxylase-like metal-dependent hydrolase (beta-lactamase superfamily II)
VLELEDDDDKTGVYFRYLVPGVDYCESCSLNPITKLIFEIGAQMRNIVYMIGDRKAKECFVVDPCWDVNGIMREARKDGMRIIGALQTHNHFDHVGGKPPPPFDGYHISVPGVKKLLEKLDSNAKVYIHQLDADVFQSETEVDPDHIITTTDGQVIQIGQVEIKCMHTPGHTPGSQCFQVNSRRVLTGDTVFVRSCGRTDLPGGCEAHLYDSLKNRIGALPNDTVLFPAHLYGQTVMTTVALEKKYGLLNLDNETWLEKMQPPSN